MSESKKETPKDEASPAEAETLSEQELSEAAGGLVIQTGGLKTTETVSAQKAGTNPLSVL